jgi:hypothetical protein
MRTTISESTAASGGRNCRQERGSASSSMPMLALSEMRQAGIPDIRETCPTGGGRTCRRRQTIGTGAFRRRAGQAGREIRRNVITGILRTASMTIGKIPRNAISGSLPVIRNLSRRTINEIPPQAESADSNPRQRAIIENRNPKVCSQQTPRQTTGASYLLVKPTAFGLTKSPCPLACGSGGGPLCSKVVWPACGHHKVVGGFQ